ncbi:MAG: hypothetical protein NC416_19695 [Eubacterium sp.]|nr:hypothetical protein [Eubacterium sp.]
MKRDVRPFFMTAFLAALSVFMLVFQSEEHDSGVVIDRTEADTLTAGKQLLSVSEDLLYYQGQQIPYIRDANTFLIPADVSADLADRISSSGNAEVYFVPKETPSDFWVYIVEESAYYETSVSFIPSAVLTFRTEAFESENAYGNMDFYMPDDDEIGMYSFKSSEAKLSYEKSDAGLPRTYRNYVLKLTKKGEQNKLNLANLRKDDDWELDSLFDCSDQILQFYEGWNALCTDMGKERFMIRYQMIEFYIDEQYMGRYLLRVPLDEKQLNHAEGVFLTEETAPADTFDDAETDAWQNLLDHTIEDSSLRLECYFWMEETQDGTTTHVLPRRFIKREMENDIALSDQ